MGDYPEHDIDGVTGRDAHRWIPVQHRYRQQEDIRVRGTVCRGRNELVAYRKGNQKGSRSRNSVELHCSALDSQTDRDTENFREIWEIEYAKGKGSILSKLILHYNDANETIELSFKNEELQNFLSSSIQQSSRTWFQKKSCWVIVPDVLPDVISFSRHLFNHIDSSSLPLHYQKIIQNVLQGVWNKSKNTVKSTLRSSGDHAELFLLESAPDFVVKATYKALAKRYHPDGDEPDADKFKRIKDAYEGIVKSCDY